MEQEQRFELTDDQRHACDAVAEWFANGASDEFVLGGYAGTGKTTVIKSLVNEQRLRRDGNYCGAAVVSFTGKAVSVLRSKGVKASTMHSLMYVPVWDEETEETHFERRDGLGCAIVIVDEASMVSNTLYADLRQFGVPVLYVGDVGQLEPIGKNPNLMARTDYVLEEIHRQAAGSPIIRLSIRAREGVHPNAWTRNGVEFGDYRDFEKVASKVDQAICGYNRTRTKTNDAVREQRGYKGLICEGERVICLANNRRLGVYNGLQATVIKVEKRPKSLTLTVETDDGETKRVLADEKQFGKERFNYNEHLDRSTGRPRYPDKTFWDYAYCITCHKAQGSEADSVAVIEQLHPDWDARRWRYTAITRAKKELVYCW